MSYSLKRVFTALSALGLIALMSACVSVPRQPFDKQSSHEVKRIALLEVDDPPEYGVLNVGGFGSNFGLIGALVQAADVQSKTGKFTATARDANFYLGRELGTQVKQALEQRGYEVTYITGVRSKKNAMETDFQKIATDADAILDLLIVQSGYYSGSLSTYYVPWLRMSAKLVSTKTQQPLYQQTYAYGEEITNVRGLEFIKADTKYQYTSFDDLREHTPQALEGLRNAASVVAGKVSEAL
jgi:hypothetical protein